MPLRSARPIAFFDLETTGIDPAQDRIVEIAVLRVEPDGGREMRCRRIHPERPIPPAATRIHGIRDEDVADEPPFSRIAHGLLDFLGDADLAGYNIRRFDAPLLEREFRDCGLDLDLGRRKIIDVMQIYHRMERRDLSAAVRLYLDREHVGAHGAQADVEATAAVLDAQVDRYQDVPESVDELAGWLDPVPADAIDRRGKFVWSEGRAVFSFGRHQGRSLEEVVAEAPDYLVWITRSDFPADAKRIVDAALGGVFPVPPAEKSQSR